MVTGRPFQPWSVTAIAYLSNHTNVDTHTSPQNFKRARSFFLHLLLKPRAQLPLREGSLCCKLKQIVHSFRGHCLCFLLLSWVNFKRKYYNKNVNQKVTLSVIVRQTRLFTSSFAFQISDPVLWHSVNVSKYELFVAGLWKHSHFFLKYIPLCSITKKTRVHGSL